MGWADDELFLVTVQLQADSGDSHGEQEKEEADDIQERDPDDAPEEVLSLYMCFAWRSRTILSNFWLFAKSETWNRSRTHRLRAKTTAIILHFWFSCRSWFENMLAPTVGQIACVTAWHSCLFWGTAFEAPPRGASKPPNHMCDRALTVTATVCACMTWPVGTIWAYAMRHHQTAARMNNTTQRPTLKGKFTQKANWDMLLYTMSQFEWHRSCPSMTFRSWDMTSESSDLIISMTSLTPSLYRSAHSWIQWRHRNDVINDVIKTFRGRISRTKRHRLARPMSFESAHCVQQHISVCFLGELPL